MRSSISSPVPLGLSLSLRVFDVMVFVFEAMYPIGETDFLAKIHPPRDPSTNIIGNTANIFPLKLERLFLKNRRWVPNWII
jgi:hypothetical protein